MAREKLGRAPAHAGFGLLVIAVLTLAACGAFDRTVPDEFAVTTRVPLAIPNEFSLPPPRPGTERTQEQAPRLQAEAALVPELALTGGNGPDSPGQQALLRAAGPAPPRNIRRLIDQEAQPEAAGITDKLLFWNSARSTGAALDPAQEAARLRRQGVASSPSVGVPTSTRSKSTGLFDRLF